MTTTNAPAAVLVIACPSCGNPCRWLRPTDAPPMTWPADTTEAVATCEPCSARVLVAITTLATDPEGAGDPDAIGELADPPPLHLVGGGSDG